MGVLLLSISILIGSYSSAPRGKVCFTFDDLPIVSYGMNDSAFQANMFDKLVVSLKSNDIPAIGFVNEQKLHRNNRQDSFQISLLRKWVMNGLELGNHTYSHPDYNKVSFQKFTLDVLKGEVITNHLVPDKVSVPRYFRHPFLHVGNTKAKADSLSEFLRQNKYEVAPVTIDNEDYLFAVAYKRAYIRKDTALMKQIGDDYITYMEQKLLYFEKQAHHLFGRNINQILLLHASLLNSDYVNALADMFRDHNYDFASMGAVLEDEAYDSEITVYGNWGISWIDKWALSQGKKGDFFKDEPTTPEYIRKLSN